MEKMSGKMSLYSSGDFEPPAEFSKDFFSFKRDRSFLMNLE